MDSPVSGSALFGYRKAVVVQASVVVLVLRPFFEGIDYFYPALNTINNLFLI